MSLLLVSMDAVALNVALPDINHDFGAAIAELQWTVDAYTLVVAALLVLSGSTADRLGRRRTFQIGVSTFTLGSLLCSLAPGVGWLIFFRMVQAVGGSMMNPVAMSLITAAFPDKATRAKAVGVWSAVTGISLGIGPLVGGILTDTVGWRGIFWINVPLGIAAVILTATFVPESRSATRRRLDPLGQLLMVVFLVGLVAGLIEGPRLGWGAPGTLGLFAAAVVALVWFAFHGARHRDPVINTRFFRSLPFSTAALTAMGAFAANGALMFALTLYLQEVRGFSPFEAGLHTLPLAVAQIIFAPISGRLVASRGTRLPLILSAVLLAVAALGLTPLSPSTPMPYLLTTLFVFGVGLGLVNAPITTTAVSTMPVSQSGAAAAVASTSRQVGTALGVALAGTLTGIGAHSSVDPAAFATATHALWWVFVGVGLFLLTLALVATSAAGRRSAARVSVLLEAGA